MKCIVIETSPERTNAKPVTNEDGTPHVYATMTEARAELRANGYSYSRANDRYYLAGTDYRAYIIREDSEEYAEIIAEQAAAEETADEYVTPAPVALVRAYAEAIGEYVDPDNDPEGIAAAYVFNADVCGIPDPDDQQDRATVAAMVEAIAKSTTEDAAHDTAAVVEIIAGAADRAATRAWCSAQDGDAAEAERIAKAIAPMIEEAQRIADACSRIAAAAGSRYARDLAERAQDAAAMVEQYAYNAAEDARDTAEDPEPAPVYQRHELEAYLGDYADDYDMDAIEAEATEYDPKTGARVWTAFGDDLAAIAERHAL